MVEHHALFVIRQYIFLKINQYQMARSQFVMIAERRSQANAKRIPFSTGQAFS